MLCSYSLFPFLLPLPLPSRDDPVHESCVVAVRKLAELVKADNSGKDLIMDPKKDLGVKDVDNIQLLDELKDLETAVLEYQCNKCPQFEEHVCMHA